MDKQPDMRTDKQTDRHVDRQEDKRLSNGKQCPKVSDSKQTEQEAYMQHQPHSCNFARPKIAPQHPRPDTTPVARATTRPKHSPKREPAFRPQPRGARNRHTTKQNNRTVHLPGAPGTPEHHRVAGKSPPPNRTQARVFLSITVGPPDHHKVAA